MADYCVQAAPGNAPVIAICEEMRQRFALSQRAMMAAGGVLEAAITFADAEYREALPPSADAPWQPPRAQPHSFVRFLDAHHFVIPWYFENRETIAQVQTAVASGYAACVATFDAARCAGSGAQQLTANALADLWFRAPAPEGWSIRADPGEHPERTVDQIVDDGLARCSEWTVLEFASAVILNFGMRVSLQPARQEMHLEPYLLLQPLQTPPSARALLWHHPLYKDNNARTIPRPFRKTAVTTVPRSDLVVGIAINRAVTTETTDDAAYRSIHSQLPFVQSATAQSWIQEVLGDLIFADDPCSAGTHYASAGRSSGGTRDLEEKLYQAMRQCRE